MTPSNPLLQFAPRNSLPFVSISVVGVAFIVETIHHPIAVINRARVNRDNRVVFNGRSTSRAIVFRKQWRDRRHPEDVRYLSNRSTRRPTAVLSAIFDGCGNALEHDCCDEAKQGWAPLASRRSKTLCSPGGGRPETHQSRSPTLQMASDASALSGAGLL